MMGMRMSNARYPVVQGGIFEREDYEDMRTQLGNLGKIPKIKKTYGDMEIDYMATSETPDKLEDLTLCVGEGFAGPPFSEVAHIDLLLGLRSGPVGKAIERALGEPRPGHRLVIINEHPQTMLVPTVTVRGAKAEQLVYEEAANGINLAITHATAEGTLPEALLEELCMITNVFVHPAAGIPPRVKMNNYKAMRGAIRKAIECRPTLHELINEKEAARHPFRYSP